MIGYANVEIEEFGDGCLHLNVTVKCQVWAGEPAVPFYPDGSGYPGSPPEAELLDFFVEEAYDVDGNEVEMDEDLETAIEDYLYDNSELWYEEAIENASESYYD